jgi:hypothetical protein
MNETRVKPNPATWEPFAAFACFAGSILSLALGFAFTTDWLLNAVRHPLLHAVGIALLIIGIPILILGGHCLDLMEKKNKKSDRVLQPSGARYANNSNE